MRFSPILVLTVLVAAACGDSTRPVALVTPTGVDAEALSANVVRVSYDRVRGAAAYVIQRATGDGEFETIATPSAATFEDASGAPGTRYRYRVAAARGRDTTAFSPIVEATTLSAGRGGATLSGDMTASRTLVADTVYVLRGPVRVRSGATLRIGAGTRIVGDSTVVGSSLLIERGAKIYAEGTATHPIVFTSQRAPGARQPGDWGGVSIIGRARVNLRLDALRSEGPDGGTGEYIGGTNDADDSGVLRYVRIEFAGQAVHPHLEMNSLSLYAVGSGTTIEYVQTLAGLDDGFKWFGGTVNGRYLVSYEAGDDNFDASQGYRGRNQFLIALQSVILLPRAGNGAPSEDHNFLELDNCEEGVTGCPAGFDVTPYNVPVFANFTAVGPGNWDVATYGGNGMILRRGTGASLVNGAVIAWPKTALTVRDPLTDTQRARDSILLRNILFAQNGTSYDPSGAYFGQREKFADAAIEESGLGVAALLTRVDPGAGAFDWTPAPGSPLASGGLTTFPSRLSARAGTFIEPTSYRGAVSPGGPRWWEGWTSYARN